MKVRDFQLLLLEHDLQGDDLIVMMIGGDPFHVAAAQVSKDNEGKVLFLADDASVRMKLERERAGRKPS